MAKKYTYIILLLLIASAACTTQPKKEAADSSKPSKETLLKVNKKMVESEEQRIEDFLNRYKWHMTKTKTGLRYMIYKNGDGPKAEIGKIAKINYSVKLLTGELCYSSNEMGPKEFMIGKGGVESGLEEAILFLKKSDRVKIIIPSHLAFGLIGDGGKIPAKATLVYDLELIELK